MADKEAETTESLSAKRSKPWAGKRLVALVAAVATVSLLAGILIMQFLVSPAELAARAEAPEPGPVTALVEERIIENVVTTRGEVTYADPVQVTVDTAFVEGRPIVTGQVPEVGAVFTAASVALEIVGRPVIVLPGELPSYRSLSIGMKGPDVLQLKKALEALGYWAGDPSSDIYEWDTASAVGELYAKAGYSPSTGGPEAAEALRMAEAGLRSAEIGITRANAAWNAAAAGGATDLSVENAEISEAQVAYSDAADVLEEAQIAVQPTLPSSEVLFLSSLPRRVDEVFVKRGDELDGPAMTVSGATLAIQGTVSSQDAELLHEGMTAVYDGPGGAELTAEVVSVEAPKSKASSDGSSEQKSDRYQLRLAPEEITEEQIGELRGKNVRVMIPVASTEGTVLAVPLAALSAAADGGNRVELLTPTDDDPFMTETVPVTVGLSAGGFVEVSSGDSRLEPGVKVVVGR